MVGIPCDGDWWDMLDNLVWGFNNNYCELTDRSNRILVDQPLHPDHGLLGQHHRPVRGMELGMGLNRINSLIQGS